MARPTKQGLDYFPLDTNTDCDLKFQIIESRYGLLGYGIILKIYQLIYGDKGYYCKWDELISAIFASKWSCAEFPVTEKQVSRVVREAARYGIFSKEKLNEYGILTSDSIQRRYLEISKRRKLKEFDRRYLLISISSDEVNVNNNSVNVNNNSVNVDNNPTKKRKGNKSISLKRDTGGKTRPTLSEIKRFVSAEKLNISPEKFFKYYEAKKWKNVPDWKAKCREWHKIERKAPPQGDAKKYDYAAYDISAFEEMLDKE